jgi:hypothetical protein
VYPTLALTAVLLVGPMITVVAAHDHQHLPNRLRVEPDVSLALGITERGQLPFYIKIRNCEIGRAAGYGVKLWVDTVQVYTNESVSRADYSFSLDLRKLGVGYHYILTNVCDHHDHVGVSAMWIQITSDLRVIRYSDAPPELVKRWREGDTDWPGKLTTVSAQKDALTSDTWLNCCGDYGPWPVGAQDKAFFRMLRR